MPPAAPGSTPPEALVDTEGLPAGSFVVVSFNLYGADGKLIKTSSKSKQTLKPGQKLAIGSHAELAQGQKVASVKATVKSENQIPPTSAVEVGVGPVKVSRDVDFKGQIEVSNPSASALSGTRFEVVCRDSSGNVIGGGDAYPDLVPAKDKTMAEAFLTASGVPAKCDATYLGAM